MNLNWKFNEFSNIINVTKIYLGFTKMHNFLKNKIINLDFELQTGFLTSQAWEFLELSESLVILGIKFYKHLSDHLYYHIIKQLPFNFF